jgi:hypothetical protein
VTTSWCRSDRQQDKQVSGLLGVSPPALEDAVVAFASFHTQTLELPCDHGTSSYWSLGSCWCTPVTRRHDDQRTAPSSEAEMRTHVLSLGLCANPSFYNGKIEIRARCRLLTSVIPASWEDHSSRPAQAKSL